MTKRVQSQFDASRTMNAEKSPLLDLEELNLKDEHRVARNDGGVTALTIAPPLGTNKPWGN